MLFRSTDFKQQWDTAPAKDKSSNIHSETIRPCIEYGFKSSIPAWRLGVFQPPSRHTEMESPSDPMVADIRSHENPRYDASNRATTKSSMVSMGRVLPCSITLEELVGNPQRGGGTRNLHSVRPTTYAQPMPSLPNSDPETRRQTQRTRQGGQKAMHAFPQRGMETTIPASCS